MTWEQIKVGAKFCAAGLPEAVKLDIVPFGLLLMIRQESTGTNMAWNYQKGVAQFRTVMVDNHIVFLSRFGMSPWQLSMFHMAEASVKKVPSPASKMPLYIILVDRSTGKILAKRMEALSSELARKLTTLMAAQDPDNRLLNKAIMERRITQKYTTLQLAVLANMHTKLKT